MSLKILYVCDADNGGIAEYSIRQFHTLVEAGAKVSFLCRPTFPIERLDRLDVRPDLPAARPRLCSPWFRALRQIIDAREVARVVVNRASQGAYDAVLFACYREYFAPLWAPVLRRAARRGIKIGTIAHDAIRDFVLGPRWWHRWSVRQGYSFVRHVFVHDQTPIDFGGNQPPNIKIHLIPHGTYRLPPVTLERDGVRGYYGFESIDQVFLSFGQIRDGKNLDRFLRAMTALPKDIKLLVAGMGGGASQRPPEFYVDLARQLGLEDRCRWDLRYIPQGEIGNIFAAADHLLMIYSGRFRSASGVMNAAVDAQKTILASSGPGAFRTAVKGYHLGVFVTPDDDEEVLQGAKTLLADPPEPQWTRYESENSWEENARQVISAFRSSS